LSAQSPKAVSALVLPMLHREAKNTAIFRVNGKFHFLEDIVLITAFGDCAFI
jgi:hypothetical protein